MSNLLVKLTFFAVFILAISSCQKEKNAVEYSWKQTGCSDPWGTTSSQPDTETEEAIINYFNHDNRKIKVFDVLIDHSNDFATVCEACQCPTGTIIIVSVDKRNETEMLELGFDKN